MDYVKPADVAKAMADTGLKKLALPPRDLLIRGMLSGAILGVATSLAFTAAVSTGQPLVGALLFPVGLIFIVLLGLELITRSFALLPLPWLGGGPDAPRANRGPDKLGVGVPGELDRQRDLRRASCDRAHRHGQDRSVRSSRVHRQGRRSQDHRLRGLRRRRHGHGLRQGDPVQLDGLPRRRT